jgi:hypothetical protein
MIKEDRHYCDRCKDPIPSYPECAGGVGFVSPMSDQLPGSATLAQVEGHKAIQGIPTNVCIHCYVDDFEQAYPGAVSPLREKADFIKEDPDRAKRLGLVL